MAKQTKITKMARGQICKAQLPGVCDHNEATAVFAHYRAPGLSGVGQKPSDMFGAFLCYSCHAEVDRRTRVLEGDFVKLEFLKAVIRTQNDLRLAGLIKVDGE
ncbi:MAG: DUF1364 family protein [Neisseriaceae bacterium]|nr:DUF1364 family protein [Neisseriaceae bacterium]